MTNFPFHLDHLLPSWSKVDETDHLCKKEKKRKRKKRREGGKRRSEYRKLPDSLGFHGVEGSKFLHISLSRTEESLLSACFGDAKLALPEGWRLDPDMEFLKSLLTVVSDL